VDDSDPGVVHVPGPGAASPTLATIQVTHRDRPVFPTPAVKTNSNSGTSRVQSLRLAVSVWLSTLMLAFTSAAAYAQGAQPQKETERVIVLTTREEQSIEPLLRVFEELTGVAVRAFYLGENAMTVAQDKVSRGEADLFIANEFSQLVGLKSAAMTEPVAGHELIDRIPAQFRDPDGHWFGLTRRARVIATSRERVKKDSFTYEDLADPRWKGRLCVRALRHPYNVTLTASIMAHRGELGAEFFLRGVKANLGRKPEGGDRDQIRAIHEGRCDIALVNSYYLGSLLSPETRADQRAWAESVDVHYPNSGDRGPHTSISGMALLKGAPNLDAAILLMDFMTSEPAQFVFANENHEFPIREDVKPSSIVARWGVPHFDQVPLGYLEQLIQRSRALIDRIEQATGQ
jgi:iron(III) transport system substrate-binding protein